MNEIERHLRNRTMAFALTTTRLCRALPKDWEGEHVAEQLFRSATSVAANYRASCRARSRREFIAKLGLVVEEADESAFWLEFLIASELRTAKDVTDILSESRELVAIFSASSKTARANDAAERANRQKKMPTAK